jgi:predicted regulator of Ras-like GTPase activity (Roadblock/LC7/MglB family)
MLNEGNALLGAVADIDGFILACLVDASTGMVLASRKDHESIAAPTAAAGAADIVNVLSMLAGEVETDGLEDVMVTFRSQFYVIRPVSQDPDPHILLLVILDRLRTNLAMARREIRNFCANFAA